MLTGGSYALARDIDDSLTRSRSHARDLSCRVRFAVSIGRRVVLVGDIFERLAACSDDIGDLTNLLIIKRGLNEGIPPFQRQADGESALDSAAAALGRVS